MKKSKAKFFGNLALILFFLGFPFVGLIFFWNHAHRNIENRGIQFIETTYAQAIQDLMAGTPDESISYRVTQDQDPKFWPNLAQETGPYQSHSLIPPVKSYALEENDKVAQYMEATIQTKFQNTTKTLKVKIRRETVVPRWRYVELTPQ